MFCSERTISCFGCTAGYSNNWLSMAELSCGKKVENHTGRRRGERRGGMERWTTQYYHRGWMAGGMREGEWGWKDRDHPRGPRTAGFPPSLYLGVRCEVWPSSSTKYSGEKKTKGLNFDLRARADDTCCIVSFWVWAKLAGHYSTRCDMLTANRQQIARPTL